MEFLKGKDVLIVKSTNPEDVKTFGMFAFNATNAKKVGDILMVEINIYDSEVDFLMQTEYEEFSTLNGNGISISERVSNGIVVPNSGSIIINSETILRKYNYNSGRFRVRYKFYENILGSQDENNRVFIKKVSPSRKEISLDFVSNDPASIMATQFSDLSELHFPQFSDNFYFNKFANFGKNKLLCLLNAKNEYNEKTNTHSLFLKLYDALPSDLGPNSSLWIIKLYMDEIEDEVVLYDSSGFLSGVYIMKPPKFDDVNKKSYRKLENYKNYNEIVGDDTYHLKDVILDTISGSDLYGVDLNIDYSYFKNHVHFGSATQLLQNFKTKVEQIEYYSILVRSGSTSSSFAGSSSMHYKAKREEIVSNLTKYERFLYFQSGSYFTSSAVTTASRADYTDAIYNSFMYVDNGELRIDATWPKNGSVNNSGYPYNLYSPTSSISVEWYDIMTSASMEHDFENADWLGNTVPQYIREDIDANADYITLINMTGEFYDNIWTYIDNYYKILKRENKLSDGVSSDLLWNILKNNGIIINNSRDLVDINKYFYGVSITGTPSSYTVNISRAEQEITQEIWNRLLNNVPYLYKSKGTRKSIKSLLSCYGIPNTYVSVREFGGPYQGTFSDTSVSGTFDQKYEFTLEDFTHVVNFTGVEYISIPWVTSSLASHTSSCDAVEFRFRTNYTGSASEILLEKSSSVDSSGSFKLELKHSYRNLGYLAFSLMSSVTSSVSSSLWPFYNNEFYNVLIRRSVESDTITTPQDYTLLINKYDDALGKITISQKAELHIPLAASSSNAAYVASGTLYLGGKDSSRFRGSMDDFRLWSEIINDATFAWHTNYISATNGNTLTSSLDTLAFRLSFNVAQNLGANPSMSNEGYASTTYTGGVTASAIGFPSKTVYPFNFSDHERTNTVSTFFVTPSTINSDSWKVRIEPNYISQSVTLPDGYIVRPLRLPLNSEYDNYILDASKSIAAPIEGEQSPFNNTDIDNDRLLIGFTPVEFINNDMIAFFGNQNILNELGDPKYMYDDHYPSSENLKKIYWDHTSNPIDFYDYITYIRSYDQSMFEQIREMVPIKANLIMGTVYEPTMLTRSRTRLIHPEKAFNVKQRKAVIDAESLKFIDGDWSDAHNPAVFDMHSFIRPIFNNLVLPDAKITGTIKEVNSALESDKQIILNDFQPKGIDCEYKEYKIAIDGLYIFTQVNYIDYSFVLNHLISCAAEYHNYIGYYWYKFNPYDLKDSTIDSHNKQIFDFYTALNRTIVNTSADTPDRGPVVEIHGNSGTQLKVNYFENPKLLVD